MQQSKLKIGAATAAVLVAPPNSKSSIDIAVFTDASGGRMACNANLRPFSIVDGTQLTALSSERETISANDLKRHFVSVGSCTGCSSNIVCTASMADAIDVAAEDIHCPMCASLVHPSIDNMGLVHALAAEVDDMDDDTDDSDDDSEDDDTDDMDDDSEDDDSEDNDSEDDDSEDDDSDDDYDDSEDDDSEDDDSEDDDSDDDGDDSDDDETTEDDDEETASRRVVTTMRRRSSRISALAEEMTHIGDGTEMPTVDEVITDPAEEMTHIGDGTEMPTVDEIAAIRKRIRAVAADTDDEDDADDSEDLDDEDGDEEVASIRRRIQSIASGEDLDDEDGDSEDEDDYEDEDDEVASIRTRIKMVAAEMDDDVPVAGRGKDREDIDEMNETARAALARRRGAKRDGNVHLKGRAALAADDMDPMMMDDEGDDTVSMDDVTPGTNDDSEVPGAEMISSTRVVNWRSDPIELLASADAQTYHVVASGRPVGRLVKASASEGVAKQWGTAVLTKAFQSACSRGLIPSEAKELGFVAERYRVQGSDVVRTAMRRQGELATAGAQREVARNTKRYQQAVRTALIAALKGTFPDLPNPTRERLVASLAKLSVADPRSVVDSAFASSVDALLTSVFNKADEIAAKSDAARNELADIVATSSYQSRVTTEGDALAARLAAGSSSAHAAFAGARVQAEKALASSHEEVSSNDDVFSRIRSAVASVSGNRR